MSGYARDAHRQLGRTFAERHMPILMSVERFLRPSHVEDGHLVGYTWCLELHCEVPVRAFVPKSLDTDEAAANGTLVLDRGMRRLTRARVI
jgi:hypothetical protein